MDECESGILSFSNLSTEKSSSDNVSASSALVREDVPETSAEGVSTSEDKFATSSLLARENLPEKSAEVLRTSEEKDASSSSFTADKSNCRSEKAPGNEGNRDSTEVIAAGIASVLGPVITEFDRGVESAIGSQNALESSINRLTRELDKLLEDTPLPFVAQHAARLSLTRKRVLSLTSTLQIIQGRIENIGRLLSTQASTSTPKLRQVRQTPPLQKNRHKPRHSRSSSPELPPVNDSSTVAYENFVECTAPKCKLGEPSCALHLSLKEFSSCSSNPEELVDHNSSDYRIDHFSE